MSKKKLLRTIYSQQQQQQNKISKKIYIFVFSFVFIFCLTASISISLGDVHPKTSVFDNGFACGVVTIKYPNFLRNICAAFNIVGVNCIVPIKAIKSNKTNTIFETIEATNQCVSKRYTFKKNKNKRYLKQKKKSMCVKKGTHSKKV